MDDQPSHAWGAYIVGIFFLAIALMALMFFAPEAHAQAQCGPWKEIRAKLEGEFKQTKTGVGLVDEKSVITLYQAEDGKRWALLAVGSDGNACVIAVGVDWQQSSPLAGGDPA